MSKSSICLFPTFIYSSKDPAARRMNPQLLKEIRDIENLDAAAKAWSKENYKNGFTTYASGNNLHQLSPTFHKLEKLIDSHVKKYVKVLDWDLGGRKLKMNTCWVNVMEKNTHHGLHLHPLSVVSGTYYVSVPVGSSGIKFEDPRLSSFMGSPPRGIRARKEVQYFYQVEPKAGSLVLFESWLRHEVPLHTAKQPRISISFNYDWE